MYSIANSDRAFYALILWHYIYPQKLSHKSYTQTEKKPIMQKPVLHPVFRENRSRKIDNL